MTTLAGSPDSGMPSGSAAGPAAEVDDEAEVVVPVRAAPSPLRRRRRRCARRGRPGAARAGRSSAVISPGRVRSGTAAASPQANTSGWPGTVEVLVDADPALLRRQPERRRRAGRAARRRTRSATGWARRRRRSAGRRRRGLGRREVPVRISTPRCRSTRSAVGRQLARQPGQDPSARCRPGASAAVARPAGGAPAQGPGEQRPGRRPRCRCSRRRPRRRCSRAARSAGSSVLSASSIWRVMWSRRYSASAMLAEAVRVLGDARDRAAAC